MIYTENYFVNTYGYRKYKMYGNNPYKIFNFGTRGLVFEKEFKEKGFCKVHVQPSFFSDYGSGREELKLLLGFYCSLGLC